MLIAFTTGSALLGLSFIITMSSQYDKSPYFVKQLSLIVEERRTVRHCLCLAVIAVIFIASLSTLFVCDRTTYLLGTNMTGSPSPDSYECFYPQYFVFCWILTMIASVAFLKLSYLLKFIILAAMATIYLILVEFVFNNVFSRSQSCGMSMQYDG
ncbi:unnamed protein product [Oppiella nova]|uniref:Uncharacterized protein n=1 Tax=Oppiella nova TaxID=334625 RepID=A0A7R9MHP2_9ACAR|nr:unnamed protein product [Oppiella nova]CAG2177478.1 unnamed protein product [Oppiella nova]